MKNSERSTATDVAWQAHDKDTQRTRGAPRPGNAPLRAMTQRQDPRGGAATFVLLCGVFMTTADNSIVNVAVPSLRADLGASDGQIQFVVAGYILAFAALLVTAARLGDLYGYRRLFLLGLATFTATSFACGMAPSVELLIAARVGQGVGAALLVPQVLTAIQTTFRGERRARAIGFYSMALAGGAAAGQIVGGALASADLFGLQWRPVFLINVPLGILLLAIGRTVLPPTQPARSGQRLDLAGVGAMSLAISLALVPLIMGREAGWPWWAWATLGASLPVGAAFVALERRMAKGGGSPLIDLRTVSRPVIAFGLMAQAGAAATYSALLFVIALHLQEALGRSALYSGTVLLAWVIGFAAAGPTVVHVVRLSGAWTAPAGLGLLSASYLGMAFVGLEDVGRLGLLGLLATGGFGMGVGFTALMSHLAASVSEDEASNLSGAVTTNSELAAALGVAVFGSLYLAGTDAAASTRSPAFALTLIALAVSALIAALAASVASRAEIVAETSGVEESARPRAQRNGAVDTAGCEKTRPRLRSTSSTASCGRRVGRLA